MIESFQNQLAETIQNQFSEVTKLLQEQKRQNQENILQIKAAANVQKAIQEQGINQTLENAQILYNTIEYMLNENKSDQEFCWNKKPLDPNGPYSILKNQLAENFQCAFQKTYMRHEFYDSVSNRCANMALKIIFSYMSQICP